MYLGVFFAPGYIDIWYYAHAEKMGIMCLNICTFFGKCQVNRYSFYVRDGVYFPPQMSTFWKMERCRQYTCNIFLNCHMYTNIVIGTFLVCTSALKNVGNFDMTHITKKHSSVVKTNEEYFQKKSWFCSNIYKLWDIVLKFIHNLYYT